MLVVGRPDEGLVPVRLPGTVYVTFGNGYKGVVDERADAPVLPLTAEYVTLGSGNGGLLVGRPEETPVLLVMPPEVVFGNGYGGLTVGKPDEEPVPPVPLSAGVYVLLGKG